MKISSFNPMIKSVHNQAFMNARREFNNLSPLTQDTISFGSSASARKLVEKFRTYNPNGQYNIKQSEAEAIYKYFGFSLDNGSSHKTLTGPYGQTYTYSNKSQIDPANASALIRGIQMADEFNGELILFNKKATDEEIQKWKKIIAERKATKGFVNQYAIDNKERLEALHKEEAQPKVDTTKEQEKTINEFKAKVETVLVKISNEQQDFKDYLDLYNEIKENAKKNNIELPQKTIKEIDEQIEKKSQEFNTAIEEISYYKDKLSKKNNLSEEEIAKLNNYEENGIDFSNIDNSIDSLDKLYASELKKQEELTKMILDEVQRFSSDIELVSSQLEDIKKLIDEATTLTVVNKELINKLNSLYSSSVEKLEKIKSKVESYKTVENAKEPNSRLSSILNKLRKYSNDGLSSSIPELVELNKLIEVEIKPLLTMSEDEKTARSVARIEKFNKKVEQGQVAQKTVTTSSPKKEVNIEQKTQIQDEPITPVVEASFVEQKIEVPPTEKTAISIQQERVQQLKSKLIGKISPLPLENVKSAIAELVDNKYNEMALSQIEDANNTIQSFVKNITTAIANTAEFNRIKNAARFALLNSVYENSTNKPEAIFNLNREQTNDLFKAIQSGKKEIDVQTSSSTIRISLNSNFDLNSVNSVFERFNAKTININKETGKKIADEILKYAPNIPKKEMSSVLLQLSKEGAYYELLLDKDCNETLKTTLLKTFWNNYDSDNGTNYSSQVIQNYEKEQKKIKEAEMQKRKLESINTYDWSL